jgi:hypothetical protein
MLYSNGEIYINYGDMGATDLLRRGQRHRGCRECRRHRRPAGEPINAGGLIANGVTVAIAPVYRKPAAITDLRIVQDAVTNGQPFLYHYEWSPVTTDINGNSLAVDYYDFYYTFGLNPYAPFPTGWFYYTSFYTPYTPTIYHFVDDIAVRIVAVDNDGFV